jgi:hypothetical protein
MLSAVGSVRITLTIGQRPTIEQKSNQLLVCCNNKFVVKIIDGNGSINTIGNSTQIVPYDDKVLLIVEPI